MQVYSNDYRCITFRDKTQVLTSTSLTGNVVDKRRQGIRRTVLAGEHLLASQDGHRYWTQADSTLTRGSNRPACQLAGA